LFLETDRCDINFPNNAGDTLLHIAAREEHEIIVQLLLKTGKCDVNVQNNSGCVPIGEAIARGCETIVRLLDDQRGDTPHFISMFEPIEDQNQNLDPAI
jgi:ankyrin repeat protein